MKVLLVAINAKYIHSNLGVYSLKAYGDKRLRGRNCSIEIGEYTIKRSYKSTSSGDYLAGRSGSIL